MYGGIKGFKQSEEYMEEFEGLRDIEGFLETE